MLYQDYLLSPKWQAKRKQVLRRASYRCEQCGKRARLDVHHKTYERIFNEALTDLQALCRLCHKGKHSWFWRFVSFAWHVITK
jgi:5-methylcytosine-specific restriction endonuclease McrA